MLFFYSAEVGKGVVGGFLLLSKLWIKGILLYVTNVNFLLTRKETKLWSTYLIALRRGRRYLATVGTSSWPYSGEWLFLGWRETH